MQLIRKHLEIYDPCKRDTDDRRKKVTFAVFSYINPINGDEYRRKFTAPQHTPEVQMWDIAPKVITI